jgi:hypothetical protein
VGREHDIAVLCAGKSYVPRNYLDLEEIPIASECHQL